MKIRSNSAFGFLAPALAVMLLCGVLPMAFVAYYSLHDTFAGNSFIWVGLDWYKKVLASPEFHAAMIRSLAFSMIVLLAASTIATVWASAAGISVCAEACEEPWMAVTP
jgi:ABC-type sugar transport system permease subunit